MIVAGLVVIATAGFAIKAVTDDGRSDGGRIEGTSDSFKLSYPEGWEPLSENRLKNLPGNPLAVVRRKDGKGYVILRREKQAPRNFSAFSAQLTRELDQRVPDFQRQSSRIVRTRAGEAFFYSYIRRRAGTVHSVLVVPAGERSYALNTVSRGGSEQAAREIARILLSFDL
jgi:hypothetical protein